MAVYVVAYDLNKETVRPNITKAIKEFPWARLSESSYAIETALSPQEVYNGLEKFLDDNDQLYVITLKKPYWGRGPEDINKWLADRLTY